jgi:TRAP-type C4-dicarboxylate transport system permease small subunit
MIGLMQIMIYLFCIYLVYKGFEIFQIAYVSNNETPQKNIGIVIGLIGIICAFVISGIAIFLTEGLVQNMSNNVNNFPKFPS